MLEVVKEGEEDKLEIVEEAKEDERELELADGIEEEGVEEVINKVDESTGEAEYVVDVTVEVLLSSLLFCEVVVTTSDTGLVKEFVPKLTPINVGEDVILDETVDRVVNEVEDEAARLYNSSLAPAPQYSTLFPGHRKLQSAWLVALTLPAFKAFPQ